MRALVLDESGLGLDERRHEPVVGDLPPGEVLIRPTRMGVCSTDLELCKGYMAYEGVLGHEFVGVVEAVCKDVDKAWVGRRVVGEINCVCGQCDMCKGGLKEHCRDRTVLGIMGRDGCFAERFVLPAVNLHAVPDNVDDDRAVFVEPLAAALQVVRQLTIEGRPYVTVLGDGRLGLLCAQVLSTLNATVRCVGKHEAKLGLCEKWGIKHRLLEDVGLRQDQDIVVDCTGSASGLTTAMAMLRPRGTLVRKTTVAPGQMGEGFDLSPIVINELNVIGSRCGPFAEAVDWLSREAVDVVSLISKRMKLGDGPGVLEQAGKPGVIKVLLQP
ncbi:MAG: alcohol dehydrogenase catalytic domain-containing protein [Phycisphaeraceae bacterium]|nr:alcohol dehydrogenase catalytic domain-containing protein [Phycisphaeraceae bacterium]